MATKNSVDLVRDAIAGINKIEARAQDATRLLASSCMVFYSENGGNKHAKNLLAVMLHDLATEGVAMQILAWVGKNLAKYEPNLRAAMPEGATAARDAVLAQFEDRPWREIRSEHKPKTEDGVAPPVKNVPADGPLKVIDTPTPEAPAGETAAWLDGILGNLHRLDVGQLEQVVHAANEILARKAAEMAAEQAQPEAQAVNG